MTSPEIADQASSVLRQALDPKSEFLRAHELIAGDLSFVTNLSDENISRPFGLQIRPIVF